MYKILTISLLTLLSGHCLSSVDVTVANIEWKLGKTMDCTINPQTNQRICPIKPLELFSLKNNYKKKENYLAGDRRTGLDIGWRWIRARAFYLKRKGNNKSPLRYGERLALFVEGIGYIRHKKTNEGISIITASKPFYEWMLKSNSTNIGVVNSAHGLGLYNLKKKDHLVYCKRFAGINFRWSRGCNR